MKYKTVLVLSLCSMLASFGVQADSDWGYSELTDEMLNGANHSDVANYSDDEFQDMIDEGVVRIVEFGDEDAFGLTEEISDEGSHSDAANYTDEEFQSLIDDGTVMAVEK